MASLDSRKRNKESHPNVEYLTKDVKEIRKDDKVISIKVQNRNFTKKLIIASIILIIIGIVVLLRQL